MSSIDDLWEFDIRQNVEVSPQRLMEAQADYLMRLSGGSIFAKVRSFPGKGVRSELYVHEFRVGMTAPMEFEYKLFEVRQPIDIYPLQVSSEPSRVDAECNNLDELKSAVRAILNAGTTQRRLKALYSQAACNSVLPPEPVEQEVAEPAADDDSYEDSEECVKDYKPEVVQESDEDTWQSPDYDEGESVAGSASLSELKKKFKFNFDVSGYDTIGEFMRAELGAAARSGARLERAGTTLEVEDSSGKHVTQVKVIRAK